MPFTISHAAAALPFLRSRICFSALVIGSMSPDFEYILMFGFSRNISHSLYGILLFCVPVGLLFFFLYCRLWKNVLIDLAPDPLRRRLMYQAARMPKYGMGNIVLSIFLGAGSHDLIDAFTHDYGWGTMLCPWLSDRMPFLPLRYGEFSFLIISLLGLLLLSAVAVRWYFNTPEMTHCPPRERLFVPAFPVIATICGVVFMAVFAWLRQGFYPEYLPKHIVANITLGFMIYLTLMLTLAGLLVYLFRQSKD